MSLLLCLSSTGLHADLTIDPVSVDLHKILHHVSAPVDFVNDWRGAVIVPKLLVCLGYFADTYKQDTITLEEMKHDFQRHPEYTHHHLLFSTPGNPMNILTFDAIKSLLSHAMLKGTADDLPAKLTLNVQFRGSSKRLLLDLLCDIVPRVPGHVPRPSSPSGDDDDSAVHALRELGSAILTAVNHMSVTPAVISPTSPLGPSPSLVLPADVSATRSAFLAYRGLDPATSHTAVPTPSHTFLPHPNGTIIPDMFSASHPTRSTNSPDRLSSLALLLLVMMVVVILPGVPMFPMVSVLLLAVTLCLLLVAILLPSVALPGHISTMTLSPMIL
jgi:hypothetical protein